MPRKKLTATMLDTLPPGEYSDSHCDGLIFRVQIRRKAWQTRYHDGDGQRRKTFGFYPAMGLKEARDECSEFYKRREAGLPVIAESAPHPTVVSTETVGWLIDWYEEMRAKNPKGTKSLAQNMKVLRSCIKRFGPYLDMPARQFSKSDARDIRDKLDAKTPSMANRFLAYGSMCWAFCAQEDKVDTNVFRDVRRLAGEEPRERVLTSEEIAAVWNAAGAMAGFPARDAYGRMIRFLLLTGQRRGEAAALRHGDILDGIWFQKVNKASRPHKIKLPPLAMELVGKGEPRALVFQGAANQFEKRKAYIDKLASIEDWHVHDLRRSASTHMQELGRNAEGEAIAGAETIDEVIIKAILNHRVEGVSGIYLRAEYVAAKGRALRLWADEVLRIVEDNKVTASVTKCKISQDNGTIA